ncbi:Sulfotransferase domain protein [Stieleria neptunia]|uniref:Sulfotransferase domain protein n=2 Tax=Stieleria neptunia TaxID=2527979 RepID=A0A518HR08_9BACT|nr:Sulfotransferase domain protein [Stieleria neptunia]
MYEVHPLVFGKNTHQGEQNRTLVSQLEKFLRLDLSDIGSDNCGTEGARILEEAMCRGTRRRGKKRWCIKDPRLSHFLDACSTAFPDAHFIIIIRDPRAVCRSYLSKKGFTVGRPANWIAAAERWEGEVRMQLQFLYRNQGRATLVIYEELLQDFESQLRRVCDAIGIQLEPQMLNYFQRDTEINIHEGNKNIFKPPDLELANKWRSELSEKQIRTVESVTARTMETLGFERLFEWRELHQAQKWLSRIHDRVMRELRWQRHKLQQPRKEKGVA